MNGINVIIDGDSVSDVSWSEAGWSGLWRRHCTDDHHATNEHQSDASHRR